MFRFARFWLDRLRCDRLAAASVAWAGLLGTGCGGGEGPVTGTLRLATTSSVADAGLLDALLPAFRRESGIHVEPFVVSRAEAFTIGMRGDADVLLGDDEGAGERFVAAGHGVARKEVFRITRDGAAPPEVTVYEAILVRPVGGPTQRAEPARRFFEWLTSVGGRAIVRGLRPRAGYTVTLSEPAPPSPPVPGRPAGEPGR